MSDCGMEDMKSVKTHIKNKCKQVYIEKGHCTIYLRNTKLEDIEVSQDGDDVCIEILKPDLECQKVSKGEDNNEGR